VGKKKGPAQSQVRLVKAPPVPSRPASQTEVQVGRAKRNLGSIYGETDAPATQIAQPDAN